MGFSQDFLWGSASSDYQIEGAFDEDGKGLGIWDALSAGHVKHGENGDVACDHYHRYKEDVQLMKEMGLKAYRFSVSWPRVMPEEGVVNETGLDFYRNLVKELTEAGIEPMCTLFHWNLPMWLHEKGGWYQEEVALHFEKFTEVVVKALSDKVSYWMTINEPAAFIGNGYITGLHAPFESNLANLEKLGEIIPALSRNVLLSHGRAVKKIREHAELPPKIGMALNGTLILPSEQTEDAIEEARAATFSATNSFAGIDWWADAAIRGILPDALKSVINEEDLAIIHQTLDFFGYNCYNANNFDDDYQPNDRVYPGMARTAMGWPITPDALYWAAKFWFERYELPILITENGMANVDFVMDDGEIHDPQRIAYMKQYLSGLKKAVSEGIPAIGYLYWSTMDNFEWAEGYDKRFGLIHVDFQTQKRTLKESAYWYKKLIAENGAQL